MSASGYQTAAPDHYDDPGYTGPLTTISHRVLGHITYHTDAQQKGGNQQVLFQNSFNKDNIDNTIYPGLKVHTISRNFLVMRRNAAVPSLDVWSPTGPNSSFDASQFTRSTGTLAGGVHTTQDGNRPFSQFNNGLLQLNATAATRQRGLAALPLR